MPANKGLSKINLLPLDDFEKSFVGKALKWSLSAGKSIVILTEFVVILAFLSRFKLDRDLNDLNEIIAQKQAVVESYAEVESVMRAVEDQASVVSEAENQSIRFANIWSDLKKATPVDLFYDSVQLGESGITLKGIASSESGLSALLESIKGDAQYTSVVLSNVELDNRKGGVGFTLIATKPGKNTTGNTNSQQVDENL